MMMMMTMMAFRRLWLRLATKELVGELIY